MTEEKKPNPAIIRPMPGRCGLHGKVLDVPVKPENYNHHVWICIVCVTKDFYNEDITGKIRKDWPTEFRFGAEALAEFQKKEKGEAKRKGATGA